MRLPADTTKGSLPFDFVPPRLGWEPGCVKFGFLCDPDYQECRDPSCGRFPPITTTKPDEILMGTVNTYDLGWNVSANILPPECRFTFSGAALGKLLLGEEVDDEAAAISDHIWITVSCFQSSKGGRPVRHLLNKKWRLQLAVDGATSWLAVRHMQRLGFYCHHCESEVTTYVRACQVCLFFSLCLPCSVQVGEDHPHDFTDIVDLKE